MSPTDKSVRSTNYHVEHEFRKHCEEKSKHQRDEEDNRGDGLSGWVDGKPHDKIERLGDHGSDNGLKHRFTRRACYVAHVSSNPSETSRLLSRPSIRQ